MSRTLTVADAVGTRALLTVRPTTSIHQARGLLKRAGVSALPVVDDDGRPLGIVTTRDVLRAEPTGRPVSSVMSEDVLTVAPEDSVHDAAAHMCRHHVHHLVVTHGEHAVGMLSSLDLARLVRDYRFAEAPPG